MIVKKFAELVNEILGRNSQDFKVDERVVTATAETFISTFLKRRMTSGQGVPSGFFQPYTFNVLTDTVRDQKYIQPNPPFLNFGDNDGIAYIGASQDETNINSAYVLVKPAQVSNYAGLEAQGAGGRTLAMPESNRIYLFNEPIAIESVFVRMIPQTSELDDDSEMMGGSDIIGIVLEGVVAMLERKPQEDKITDNISN